MPAFINEIHYDNQGTDTDERIEILLWAGTMLTDWRLVLYNGRNGQVYRTLELTDGVETYLGQGFSAVVLTLPTNGLQNGSPDGIALVDHTDTVVQFLSYEGSFVAVDGPAAGMTSTDIGVSQSSTTPVGASLQLTGTGNAATDFAWSTADTHTFGRVNDGQVLQVAPNPAQLAPVMDQTALAVVNPGAAPHDVPDNDIVLTLRPSEWAHAGEVRIFAANSDGRPVERLDSVWVIPTGELPEGFSPTLSLALGTTDQLLQFQWAYGGLVHMATVSAISDAQVQLTFDDGTDEGMVFYASLGPRKVSTNLLVDDAAAIDLTGLTGLTGQSNGVRVNFTVYREAQFNNTVGFYVTENAAGAVQDPITGALLYPEDTGYRTAALAHQVGSRLTGANNQVVTFATEITGGQHLAAFLVANGSDPTTGPVYFSHAGANGGYDYVKQLGNNTFGFEDQVSLGDQDFDDVVVAFAIG